MPGLEDLLTKGKELDKQLVATTLRPYLLIDDETKEIRPQQAWRGASNRARVLAFLLARKAMKGLELIDDEKASPSDVIAATGVPKGSVHPTLKGLYENRPQLVDRDSKSRYWIPPWAVDNVCQLLALSPGDGVA